MLIHYKPGGGGGGSDGEGGWSPFHWVPVTVAAHLAFSEPVMSAQSDAVDEAVEDAWDWLGPFVTSLGFSGLLGFAAGAALKLVGRAVAIAVGITFALLQVEKNL